MSSIPSSFRNANNQRYTRQLFVDCQREIAVDERLIDPPYTLIHDVPGKINFRKVYVALADPTGFQISQQYLEDYQHWKLLMKSIWFREAKAIWDEELDAKLRSEGLSTIRLFAEGFEGLAPAVQLNAAKYLSDASYKPKQTSSKGRPSKEAVEAEVKKQAADVSDIEADLKRITLVKG